MIDPALALLLGGVLGCLGGVVRVLRQRHPRESYAEYIDRLERECRIGPYVDLHDTDPDTNHLIDMMLVQRLAVDRAGDVA